jgi:hypothetical protein
MPTGAENVRSWGQPGSERRAVKVTLLTADIGHNGATLDHNGFHGHRCSDERSELRQLADQRVGLASAAIRSLMAASNWLAEAANINPVSSSKAEKTPTTAGMPLMSARIGEPE